MEKTEYFWLVVICCLLQQGDFDKNRKEWDEPWNGMIHGMRSALLTIFTENESHELRMDLSNLMVVSPSSSTGFSSNSSKTFSSLQYPD